MAKLYFYYSAMNAGKTTTLLQSSFNYQERGMKTILYTPVVDHRYEMGKITSRIGLQQDAVPFDGEFDFFQHANQRLLSETSQGHRVACVLVDEAQFLTKRQVRQLCQICDDLSTPVLCYGLRSDFLANPFEGSQYLLAWADELNEIKTICHCGRKATFNARLHPEDHRRMATAGDQIEIGGNEKYVSLCRRHYMRRQVVPDEQQEKGRRLSVLQHCDSALLSSG